MITIGLINKDLIPSLQGTFPHDFKQRASSFLQVQERSSDEWPERFHSTDLVGMIAPFVFESKAGFRSRGPGLGEGNISEHGSMVR